MSISLCGSSSSAQNSPVTATCTDARGSSIESAHDAFMYYGAQSTRPQSAISKVPAYIDTTDGSGHEPWLALLQY
ncbi:hypothetical protein [Streptomyces sp. NPDC059743]|uniref:hypothetical protein n=1 Tax=Streptomyces sp. NPDC059743 TaxID=3346928 RepID=UPI0036496619